MDELLDECRKFLHEDEWIFAEDMMTDQTVRQMASEIIREKILRTLDREVPHGIAVVIEDFKEEGELTRIRADLVCEKNLARAAATIRLGSFLLLGHGEEHGGGRKRDSIVSDAMESVIAASYMDGGFSAAKEIIDRLILCDVPAGKPHNFDYKTALQELVQRKKDQVLRYELIGESGPDLDKKFDVEVLLNGKPCGKGTGSSKKRAEQAAAAAAIDALFPGEL